MLHFKYYINSTSRESPCPKIYKEFLHFGLDRKKNPSFLSKGKAYLRMSCCLLLYSYCILKYLH